MKRREAAAMWPAERVATAPDVSGARSRPPPHPAPAPAWTPRLDEREKENVHETAAARHAAEGMREVPVLGCRMRRKDPMHFGNPHNNTANTLVELECILMYVESVTSSLSHRTRAPMPPESVRVISSSVVAPHRMAVAEQQELEPHYSLAMSLYESANSLLTCISKLGCVSLTQSDTLDGIERKVNTTARDVNVALDAIAVRYSTHEVSDVQEFFIGNQQTLEECRRVIHDLTQAAHQLLVLRRVVAERDAPRAKKLFYGHQGGNLQKSVTCLQSPIFTWMEKKWFPAMNAWNSILARAREEAETSDVASAVARGRQEAFAQSDLIGDILRPDETLSDLICNELVKPLSHLAASCKKTQQHLNALRAAVAMPHLKELTECVCAVEELEAAGQLKLAGDRALLKEGKQLVLRLQQVENLEAALRLATQVGETVTLFRAIHHSNEVILQLGIAGDAAANREIVSRCNALLEEMSSGSSAVSPAEFIAARVDTASIAVAHVPSHIWSANATAAYQAACQSLTTRAAQDRVRLDLKHVLQEGGNLQLNVSGSTAVDDASNTSSSNRQLRFARTQSQFPRFKAVGVGELRDVLRRAREVGLSEQLVQDGEAYLRSVEALKLKVHFDAQLRVLLIPDPENATFEDIYKKISQLCGEPGDGAASSPERKLRLRYQDSDGDCISLVTQEDWNVFLAEEAPGGVCGAKLELYCDYMQLPHARLTDTVFTPQPVEGEEVEISPPPLTVGPPAQAGVKETALRSTLLAQQRRTGAVMDEAQKNCARLVRSYSTGVGLRRSEFLSRYKAPQRTAMDDMCLQKTQRSLGAEVESAGENSQPSRPRKARTPGAAPLGAKPGIGGGCRVESVKLRAQPASTTRLPKPLIPAPHERKGRALPRAAATARAATGSGGAAAAAAAAASASVATSTNHITPTSTNTSTPATSFVKAAATPNANANNSTVAARTAPPGAAPLELEAVKRWKDDDAHIELQTVASVASTSQRPAPNVKQCKTPVKRYGTPVKQLATKRASSGFTVTPCSKKVGFASKEGRAEGATTDNTRKKDSITVLEEKREWSTDMFMQSDVCTVASEQTTPPLNGKGCAGRQKPANVSTPSNSSLGAPSVVQPPLSGSAKKKAEVLRQLRQLREENQRALNAALTHRRTGK
ncbi:uncharacterized protein Tco025E_02525 [Trypanosoma conorhini]|uniref:PB1 domain-containing protein n=1 Tax=Trypanosoma conorhini TaxID=83891 RepID=A0A422Q3F6_9TRYP|nr:uncharacterized protein Tco025E_02525 [Trypanosoma conorhini]RNF24462.1 hypothetical protein Tco025E_02525 [Trypanosoma conorhini]